MDDKDITQKNITSPLEQSIQVKQSNQIEKQPQQIFPTQDQTTAEHANDFVVACMDFRLVDDLVYFMDSIGLNNNYDQFVLAGGSLGFTQQKFPSWSQALIQHMIIGHQLHNFREIIFVDHRDCGAYKKFYPEMNLQNQEQYHQKHMQLARDKLSKIFPKFHFRGFLMDIKGKCIQLQTQDSHSILSAEFSKDQKYKFLSSLNLSKGCD